MTRLFHYTCGHGRKGLGDMGDVKPPYLTTDPKGVADPAKDPIVWWFQHRVWFTDLTTPNRDALGLTMNFTRCDRTKWRYRLTVEPDEAGLQPWMDVRHHAARPIRDILENAPGARPRHWWVAYDRLVPVVYDRWPRDA